VYDKEGVGDTRIVDVHIGHLSEQLIIRTLGPRSFFLKSNSDAASCSALSLYLNYFSNSFLLVLFSFKF